MDYKRKLLLTDYAGNHYIRYVHRRFKLFVAIHEFDAPEAMQHHIDNIIRKIRPEPEELMIETTVFTDRIFLLYVIEHDNYDEKPIRATKNIGRALKRLAGWYKFAYLVPIAHGQQPDFDTDLNE